jgi:hypothetical protein
LKEWKIVTKILMNNGVKMMGDVGVAEGCKNSGVSVSVHIHF